MQAHGVPHRATVKAYCLAMFLVTRSTADKSVTVVSRSFSEAYALEVCV
jgi:hypothetical protein